MIHNITVQKYGIRLRPVIIDDADFILKLRSHIELSQFIGETDFQKSAQIEWLEKYQKREGDYYFCIETSLSNKPIGTVGIYNIDQHTAEWGRWVLSPTIPAAAASVLLTYYISFEILNLNSIYCRTVSENTNVISFHDNCGLIRSGYEKEAVQIKGETKDLVVHTASTQDLESIKMKLEKHASLAERILNRILQYSKNTFRGEIKMIERILSNVLYPVLDEMLSVGSEPALIFKSPETSLMGEGAVLDSLSLVTFIIEVEEKVEIEFGVMITLASENAMSRRKSPFRSLQLLAEYIQELLEDPADGE